MPLERTWKDFHVDDIMNLYEFAKIHIDTDLVLFDIKYDVEVGLCTLVMDKSNDCPKDIIDLYTLELIKKINVIEEYEFGATCDFSTLFENNIELLKEFTKTNWKESTQKLSEEELVYEFIRQTHLHMAGYASDRMYDDLLNLTKSFNQQKNEVREPEKVKTPVEKVCLRL